MNEASDKLMKTATLVLLWTASQRFYLRSKQERTTEIEGVWERRKDKKYDRVDSNNFSYSKKSANAKANYKYTEEIVDF